MSGEIVDIHTRVGYKPDVAGLARNQLAAARRAAGLSRSEFADILTPLVGWPVTAETIESWELTAVPPGDVLVAAAC